MSEIIPISEAASPQCVKMMNGDDKEDASKKLVQARLPFKPLGEKPPFPNVVSPQICKKRKLSDAESPSAKLQKNHKHERHPSGEVKEKVRSSSNDHDAEVSSSSEAENFPPTLKTRVRNTLERFVLKNSQEEISSTNESECITIEDDDSSSSQHEQGNATSLVSEEKMEVDEKDDASAVESSSLSPTTEKTTTATCEDDHESESSDESKKSSALTTPAKDKAKESSMVTPKSNRSSTTALLNTSEVSSPDGLASCSDVDRTPSSARSQSRSKISSTKKKEMQEKMKDEREKEREEKKKQKDAEKLEREKQKELKRKEKEEQKEKLKKEKEDARLEREKKKKEEKEKKEKERLEKIMQKEEEKKKKQAEIDAKQEEKKKKEEEQKQKLEEKMREENEKKMVIERSKQAFQSFFIKSKTSPSSKTSKEVNGLFMPFEVKKDMSLAKSNVRSPLDEQEMEELDQLLIEQSVSREGLKEHLNNFGRGKKKVLRHASISDKPTGDVIMLHDSEMVKKVTHHVKLLQFHLNYRPPYYGTWRRKSKTINPRNPWNKDEVLLDYEVDSDDEWEEEEPGESLSASEGEDEKEEGDDDEDDDGFIVSHGYLSEGEGCEDDEEVAPEVMKARQEAKAAAWETELKRQTQPVLPVIVGCIYEEAVHQLNEKLQETLKEYQCVCICDEPIGTTFSGGAKAASSESSSPTDKSQQSSHYKPVPEEAMPDLIRLVHGNIVGINKLIREFRMFWKQKMTGLPDVTKETGSDAKITEKEKCNTPAIAMETDQNAPTPEASEHFISKRQMDKKINQIAVREKRPGFKKTCWYVHDEFLEKYQMTSLPVPNSWEFISMPGVSGTPNSKTEESSSSPASRKPSITKFARPMTPSELAAQHAAAAQKTAQEQAAKQAALEEKQKAALEKKQQELLAPMQCKVVLSRPLPIVATPPKPNIQSVLPASPQQPSPQPTIQSMFSASSPQQSGNKRRITPIMVSPKTPTTPKPETQCQPPASKRRIIPTLLSPLAAKAPPKDNQEDQKKLSTITTQAVIEVPPKCSSNSGQSNKVEGLASKPIVID